LVVSAGMALFTAFRVLYPYAANRVIAVGLCDFAGNSSTTARVCEDAQTMQLGSSTEAKEATARLLSVEWTAASTASLQSLSGQRSAQCNR